MQGCRIFTGGSAPDDNLSQDPELLIGSWRWLSDTYYFTADGTPHHETPESAGYTLVLRFDEEGMVSTFRNGSLETVEPYEVKRQTHVDGTFSEPILYIGEHGARAEFGVSDTKLLISTAFVDGPESIYEREE